MARFPRITRLRRLCQDCLAQKRLTPATEVHHEVPIDVDPSRRLDLTNLRSLCKPCHSAITATRDSSFARSRI
jgi:5-methylcytosine-specific restriction protein A